MQDIASLLDKARHWPVRFRKRQVIYDEGDEASALFRLTSGCVRLQVNGAAGHRQIVAFLFPGDIVGLGVGGRPSAAEAVTEVELIRYPLESVLQLSAQSREVLFELLRTATVQFNDAAHHVEAVAHLPATERVSWFFAWLSRRQEHAGQPPTLPMTRRDIGDFLALSPETLSRVIRGLQDQGVLTFRGTRAFDFRHSTAPVLMEPGPHRLQRPGLGEGLGAL